MSATVVVAALFVALVACTSADVSVGTPPTPAPDLPEQVGAPDTAFGGTETGPTDSAGETLPSRPGSAALTCPTAPPLEGKVECALRIDGPNGYTWWEGPAGVGLHGRSSSTFPKPQLAIELRDDTGADVAADLFGMGAEADWLLNGMWIDRALLRNKLAYDLVRALTDGREWAPESVYVELTYNAAYYGVFALVERVERDAARLDIPRDDGTGASFIVKADEAGIPTTVQYAHWSILYPSVPTRAITSGITARLAILESDLTTANPDMFDTIDLDGAVAFVLIEEAFKNNDAFYLSHHAYVRDNGKIGFVPWDLDLTLGQPSYNDNENPASWIAYRPALPANLGQVAVFRERMASMWAEWRSTELAEDAVNARIDGIVAGLGAAVERNFVAWPMGNVDFGGTLYAVSTHTDEVARVKAFLRARMIWMDANVAIWSPYGVAAP